MFGDFLFFANYQANLHGANQAIQKQDFMHV